MAQEDRLQKKLKLAKTPEERRVLYDEISQIRRLRKMSIKQKEVPSLQGQNESAGLLAHNPSEGESYVEDL